MSDWIRFADAHPEDEQLIIFYDESTKEINRAVFKKWKGDAAALYSNSGFMIKDKHFTHWMPYCGNPVETFTFQEVFKRIKDLHDSYWPNRTAEQTCLAILRKYASINNIQLEEK